MKKRNIENIVVLCCYFLVGLLGDVSRKPIESFPKTLSLRSTASLNEPLALAEVRQLEDLLNFRGRSGVGEILLVAVNEESGVLEVVVGEGVLEFFGGFLQAGAVGGVDDVDDAVSVLVVVTPEGAEASLATDVEHLELEVLVGDSGDVETNGGDGGVGFTEFELAQNSGLTSGVKADHDRTDFTLGKDEVPESRKFTAHFCFRDLFCWLLMFFL